MSDLKELRNKLGISQEELATLIHCKIGMVGMTEIGKRELPTKSNLLLSVLEVAARQATSNAIPAQLDNSHINKWLDKRIRASEAAKERILLKKERAYSQLEQVQAMQQVAAILEIHPLFMEENSLVALQLQLLKQKAVVKQRALELELAKLKIRVVELEAGLAKAYELKV